MPCADSPIVCRLERIRQLLEGIASGDTWASFWPTLLATIAGAGIALAGAALIARRDRRERYQTRLLDALERVVTAAADHAGKILRYLEEKRAWTAADDTELVMKMNAAEMIARGEDQITVRKIGKLMSKLLDTENQPERVRLDQAIGTIVTKWQGGTYNHAGARAVVDEVLAGNYDAIRE